MRAIQEARHRNLEAEVSPDPRHGRRGDLGFLRRGQSRRRARRRAPRSRASISGMPPRWDLLEAAAASAAAGEHWHPAVPLADRISGGVRAGEWRVRCDRRQSAIRWQEHDHRGNAKNYLPWLQTLHEGAHGNADLVAHFFRRAFGLLRQGGVFGLIATNTIGQGDTRASGLTTIIAMAARSCAPRGG